MISGRTAVYTGTTHDMAGSLRRVAGIAAFVGLHSRCRPARGTSSLHACSRNDADAVRPARRDRPRTARRFLRNDRLYRDRHRRSAGIRRHDIRPGRTVRPDGRIPSRFPRSGDADRRCRKVARRRKTRRTSRFAGGIGDDPPRRHSYLWLLSGQSLSAACSRWRSCRSSSLTW